MMEKKCIIQLKVNNNIFYITENFDPSKDIEDAFTFIGKNRVKKICQRIEKDKRVKTKIIEVS